MRTPTTCPAQCTSSAITASMLAELFRSDLQALIEAEATEDRRRPATSSPRTTTPNACGTAPKPCRPPAAMSKRSSRKNGQDHSSRRFAARETPSDRQNPACVDYRGPFPRRLDPRASTTGARSDGTRVVLDTAVGDSDRSSFGVSSSPALGPRSGKLCIWSSLLPTTRLKVAVDQPFTGTA